NGDGAAENTQQSGVVLGVNGKPVTVDFRGKPILFYFEDANSKKLNGHYGKSLASYSSRKVSNDDGAAGNTPQSGVVLSVNGKPVTVDFSGKPILFYFKNTKSRMPYGYYGKPLASYSSKKMSNDDGATENTPQSGVNANSKKPDGIYEKPLASYSSSKVSNDDGAVGNTPQSGVVLGVNGKPITVDFRGKTISKVSNDDGAAGNAPQSGIVLGVNGKPVTVDFSGKPISFYFENTKSKKPYGFYGKPFALYYSKKMSNDDGAIENTTQSGVVLGINGKPVTVDFRGKPISFYFEDANSKKPASPYEKLLALYSSSKVSNDDGAAGKAPQSGVVLDVNGKPVTVDFRGKPISFYFENANNKKPDGLYEKSLSLGLKTFLSLVLFPFGCEGRPGGIQGAVPFGCEGRPGGVSRVVFPFGCEGRPAELGVVASLGGLENEEAMLSRRLQRILAKKKKFQSGRRHFKKNKDFKRSDGKDVKKGEPICYECKKPGHIKAECPKIKKPEFRKKDISKKFRKYKKKAMAAAWENSSDSDSESSSCNDEEEANLAFMANTEDKERFTFVKTKVCGNKVVDIADLEKNGIHSVVEAMNRMQWMGITTLSENKDINMAAMMIERMRIARDQIWDTKSKLNVSLPYAHLLTKVFRHFGIDLTGAVVEKMGQSIRSRNLRKSGFSVINGVWSKTSVAEGEAIIGDIPDVQEEAVEPAA
ncbi:hypothetical protein Taro_011982, partial [Colocasia esculenta]|nr:hypothetical protein [Colocasia esculenta]